MSLLGTDPRTAANLLGVPISDEVIEVVTATRRAAAGSGGALMPHQKEAYDRDPVDIAIGVALGLVLGIGIGIVVIGASIVGSGPSHGGGGDGPPDGGTPPGDGDDGPVLPTVETPVGVGGDAPRERKHTRTRLVVLDRSGQVKF